MDSKEQSELTGKTETDSQIENRLIALGVGWYRGGEIEQKGKRTMDMDNSVVIAGGGRREYKGHIW